MAEADEQSCAVRPFGGRGPREGQREDQLFETPHAAIACRGPASRPAAPGLQRVFGSVYREADETREVSSAPRDAAAGRACAFRRRAAPVCLGRPGGSAP